MSDDIMVDTSLVVAAVTSGTDGAAESMEDVHPELQRSEELLTKDLLAEALPAAEESMEELPPEDLSEQPVLGGDESAGTVGNMVEASLARVEASVAPTNDGDQDGSEDVVADGHADASDDLTGTTSDREPMRADAASDGTAEAEAAEVVSPADLVAALLETAAPRRNKRRPVRDGQANGNGTALASAIAAVDHDGGSSAVEEPALPGELVLPVDVLPAAMMDVEQDDPLWRDQWPMNEVRVVGRLLARSSDAPALDGVQRTRMELALVEQHGDEFGSMGTLPIFVMPGALGFTSIASEIRRARREKRRLAPISVEVQGILRQLPDRDGRYATERYRVLMGVEVHRITRVADDAEQFAYWRGRATVTSSRRYEYRGIPYQRVTAVVELKQRKPRLRGTSITHLPVDFLVAPTHDHADRFEHVGQRLLIEATITSETQRMNDNHPDLVGIDDPRRKAQLQVLRESIASVTMGEFPDEAAERAYEAWVSSGRPRPERRGRVPRATVTAQPAPVMPTGTDPDRAAEPSRSRQQAPGSRAGAQKRGSNA